MQTLKGAFGKTNIGCHCWYAQTVSSYPSSRCFSLCSLASALAETPSTPKAEPGTGLEGVILAGPIQGGPTRQGVPDSRPLANTEFVVEKENSTVASFKTNDQGRFQVSLPAGHYTISRKDWKANIGSYGPFEVDVARGPDEEGSVELRHRPSMRLLRRAALSAAIKGSAGVDAARQLPEARDFRGASQAGDDAPAYCRLPLARVCLSLGERQTERQKEL